jgi:hypothetical protein
MRTVSEHIPFSCVSRLSTAAASRMFDRPSIRIGAWPLVSAGSLYQACRITEDFQARKMRPHTVAFSLTFRYGAERG